MAYVDLHIHKLLWQDNMENVDFDLKALAIKGLSEIERRCITAQILCAVDVMQSLIDPEKIKKLGFSAAISNFKNKLDETTENRRKRLRSIHKDLVEAFCSIFDCRANVIKIARRAEEGAEESEKSELEEFLFTNLTQTVGEHATKNWRPSNSLEIWLVRDRNLRRKPVSA